MEIVISIVVFVLSGLLVYEKWENKKLVNKLTNALIAKTPQDFKEMEAVDKIQVKVEPQQTDLINIAELSDDEFDKKVIGA